MTEDSSPQNATTQEDGDQQHTTSEEVTNARALVLIAQGKRFSALKQYSEASESFSQACELLASTYGDLDFRSGEAFYLYGRALLDNATEQNTVLGLGQQQQQQRQDTNESNEAPSAGPSKPKVETSTPTKLSSRIHFSGDSSEEEGENADEDGEEGGEHVAFDLEDELETAYHVLEIARVIYSTAADEATNPEDVKAKRHLQSNVLALLGDVHNQGEQFAEAVEMYTAAIKIRTTITADPNASRALAELHFNVALAGDLMPNSSGVQLASEHAQLSFTMTQNCLHNLQSLPNPTHADVEEMKQIETLLPELKAKVDEIMTVRVQSEEEKQRAQAESQMEEFLNSRASVMQGIGSGPSGLPESAIVNDLNLLVKRKKPTQPSSSNGIGIVIEDKSNQKSLEEAAATTTTQIAITGKRKVEEDEEKILIDETKKAKVA